MQRDYLKKLIEKQLLILKKQGSEKLIQKDKKEKRWNMEDKGKMIITVDPLPNQGFLGEQLKRQLIFGEGILVR